jgi:hypothetical protein
MRDALEMVERLSGADYTHPEMNATLLRHDDFQHLLGIARAAIEADAAGCLAHPTDWPEKAERMAALRSAIRSESTGDRGTQDDQTVGQNQ